MFWRLVCSDLCALPCFFFNVENKTFSLQNYFLESEEELLGNRTSSLVTETAAPKFKRSVGKLKLQGIFSISFFSSHLICSYDLKCLVHQLVGSKWD